MSRDRWLHRLARASSLAVDAAEYADVPPEIFSRVQATCQGLPEVEERPAWAGTQWRVRDRMFAHVLAIDFEEGPVTVVVFRAPSPEREALLSSGLPYFQPAWGTDAVGMVLDNVVDWDEVTELLIESYCRFAPRKLVALVERPAR